MSPAVSSSASVIYRNVEATSQINDVSGDYFQVHNYNTVVGKVSGATHVDALEQVAVIDEDTRDTCFTSGTDPLGQALLPGRVPVRVIGVVSASGATFGPSSLNVWIPHTTAMTRVSGQSFLDSIEVRVDDGYDTKKAQDEITTLMISRHGSKDFFLVNSDTIRSTITSTTQTMTLLVAAIAVISLVVGGIGVAFLSATMIGITFGYLPAKAASRLDPVEALNRD